MIALIILGAIICFILLLLFFPLAIDLEYSDEFKLKVKYSGITIYDTQKRTVSKTDKKAKIQSQHNAHAKKESIFKKLYKEKGLAGTVSYLCKIISMVLERFGWAAKRFKIRRLKLDLIVATDDAADTAIQYGVVCAAIYPVLSLLCSVIDLKTKAVNINSDFDKSKWEFRVSILAKSQLIYWIVTAIGLLKQYYKLQREECEKHERKQHKDRNGNHDGKASSNG